MNLNAFEDSVELTQKNGFWKVLWIAENYKLEVVVVSGFGFEAAKILWETLLSFLVRSYFSRRLFSGRNYFPKDCLDVLKNTWTQAWNIVGTFIEFLSQFSHKIQNVNVLIFPCFTILMDVPLFHLLN